MGVNKKEEVEGNQLSRDIFFKKEGNLNHNLTGFKILY
jgi:hypothetical protein